MITAHPTTSTWDINERDFPTHGSKWDQFAFLIRYAALAPSCHNTQPWRFVIEGSSIVVFPDKSRWLTVADPDQRELYISLGCAIENLLVAAEYFGFSHQVEYVAGMDDSGSAARIRMEPYGWPSAFRPLAYFHSIPVRRTNHNTYDGVPIPEQELEKLKSCCIDPEISLLTVTDMPTKRHIDDLVIRSDAALFANPAFRDELGYWMGQGIYGSSWLMSKLSQISVTLVNPSGRVAQRDSDVLLSSPVFAALLSEHNDHATHIRVGQAFERIYLACTSLGISLQPMSQVIQTPDTKWELARMFKLVDQHIQQTFRLGFGPVEHNHTPRRPMAEVLA